MTYTEKHIIETIVDIRVGKIVTSVLNIFCYIFVLPALAFSYIGLFTGSLFFILLSIPLILLTLILYVILYKSKKKILKNKYLLVDLENKSN